ncbi:MAG: RNA 2',3'-cyclic phosphodiesterase [Thermodesulfobacteriota bacterium]
MANVRAFIAIEIPEEIKKEISSIQDELKKSLGKTPGISWARPATTHLTLKFLGDVPEEKIGDIEEALRLSTRGIKAFTVSVTGIGGFPNLENPRVLWAGIQESAELENLHVAMENSLYAVGFEKDEKPFRPHLTLARIKSPVEGKKLSKAIKELRTDINADFIADSVILFKSELSSRRAVHTPIAKTILGQVTTRRVNENQN